MLPAKTKPVLNNKLIYWVEADGETFVNPTSVYRMAVNDKSGTYTNRVLKLASYSKEIMYNGSLSQVMPTVNLADAKKIIDHYSRSKTWADNVFKVLCIAISTKEVQHMEWVTTDLVKEAIKISEERQAEIMKTTVDDEPTLEVDEIEIDDTRKCPVKGRDVWRACGSKRQFADWAKEQIERCDLVENADYELVFHKNVKNPAGGRQTAEYWFTYYATKEIGMVQGTAKGKEIRKYFIKRDEKLRQIEQQKPLAPTITEWQQTMMNVMGVSAKEIGAIKQRNAEIESRQDKLEGRIDIVEANNNFTTKDLGDALTATVHEIVRKCGGDHKDYYNQYYGLLKDSHIDVKIRAKNRAKRLKAQGRSENDIKQIATPIQEVRDLYGKDHEIGCKVLGQMATSYGVQAQKKQAQLTLVK